MRRSAEVTLVAFLFSLLALTPLGLRAHPVLSGPGLSRGFLPRHTGRRPRSGASGQARPASKRKHALQGLRRLRGRICSTSCAGRTVPRGRRDRRHRRRHSGADDRAYRRRRVPSSRTAPFGLIQHAASAPPSVEKHYPPARHVRRWPGPDAMSARLGGSKGRLEMKRIVRARSPHPSRFWVSTRLRLSCGSDLLLRQHQLELAGCLDPAGPALRPALRVHRPGPADGRQHEGLRRRDSAPP